MNSLLIREYKLALRLSRVLFKNSSRLYTDDIKKADINADKPALKEDSSLNAVPKKQSSTDKLNLLLKSMIEDDSKPTIKLARPAIKLKRKINISEKKANDDQTENTDLKLVKAVKDVAVSLGGNTNQTESELLSKLLGNPGSGDGATEQKISLSDLIVGMKIDRSKKPSTENTHAYRIREVINKHEERRQSTEGKPWTQRERPKKLTKEERSAAVASSGRVDLFGAQPIGIFNTATLPDITTSFLKTWDLLQERELKITIMHPPKNYFEKMIQWTEQGKLWSFPINNEQGMDDEKNVYFADHIFLESQLEPWCPARGPVRHFMELVCTGLSKNYHISIKDKKDHIAWFENYFENKKQLLKDVGAIAKEDKKPTEISGV